MKKVMPALIKTSRLSPRPHGLPGVYEVFAFALKAHCRNSNTMPIYQHLQTAITSIEKKHRLELSFEEKATWLNEPSGIFVLARAW
jgi:hypothetical protein